jgi:hypothetical protein
VPRVDLADPESWTFAGQEVETPTVLEEKKRQPFVFRTPMDWAYACDAAGPHCLLLALELSARACRPPTDANHRMDKSIRDME